MTLENLVQIGKLKPYKTTHEEIARLLAAARRNLKDACHADISPESRFDIAYKAVMQCALIAVMANGFRPSTRETGHHATVIRSLPKAVGPSNERVMLTHDRHHRLLAGPVEPDVVRYRPRQLIRRSVRIHSGDVLDRPKYDLSDGTAAVDRHG